MNRRIPGLSSAACSSPTPLPEAGRQVGLSKAVFRLNLSETARANGCTKLVKAFP